jgi:hypothetical protein
VEDTPRHSLQQSAAEFPPVFATCERLEHAYSHSTPSPSCILLPPTSPQSSATSCHLKRGLSRASSFPAPPTTACRGAMYS